jgi:hypothetical protein
MRRIVTLIISSQLKYGFFDELLILEPNCLRIHYTMDVTFSMR